MYELDPGHLYELGQLDDPWEPQYLQFVKREGSNYPGNVGHYPGTTLQEVLRALVQRAQYVNNQIPCPETSEVIDLLKKANWLLEVRAAGRHGRKVDFDVDAALANPSCRKCGHTGCKGACHHDLHESLPPSRESSSGSGRQSNAPDMV